MKTKKVKDDNKVKVDVDFDFVWAFMWRWVLLIVGFMAAGSLLFGGF